MRIDILEIPVFYINMAKDTDKRKYIETRLQEVGFKNVTRIDAVENKKNGRVGLSMSQYKALSQVPAPFIVLEDDADPVNFERFIDVPDNADALYLGTSQWGLMQSYSGFYLKYSRVANMKHIVRIYNMLSSHSILYLNDEYVKMCQRTTKYCSDVYPMPMDVPFAMIQRFFFIYALDKPMFIQKDYAGKMSAAPKYTRGKITEYKRFTETSDKTGIFYKDEII